MSAAINNTSISNSDYKIYFQKGFNYNQYKQQMAEDLALNTDLQVKEYIHLNQRRMHRVEKTYNISAELTEQVKDLKEKAYWLILTENWCGDASQILPVFNAIAELSEGNIEMKLLYRDQNSELMNTCLTNGTKSIPKLIQLDEHFNVTGTWGPRPYPAQKLVAELRSNENTAATYANELHLWYAKDKQQSLEKETTQLIFRANLF